MWKCESQSLAGLRREGQSLDGLWWESQTSAKVSWAAMENSKYGRDVTNELESEA